MKKIFSIFVAVLTACVCMLCLFGCDGTDELNGRYYLKAGSGQNGGPWTNLNDKDENGLYKNVVGNFYDPEQFWIELKDGTMTVHGSISVLVSGEVVAFQMNPESEHTYTYTLQVSETNEYWYSLYSNGEDTLYQVIKDGKSLAYQYGKIGPEYWYSFFYEKR